MFEELKAKYQELAAKKRAELESALEREEVADPIFTPAFFISLGVSAALSAGGRSRMTWT